MEGGKAQQSPVTNSKVRIVCCLYLHTATHFLECASLARGTTWLISMSNGTEQKATIGDRDIQEMRLSLEDSVRKTGSLQGPLLRIS